LQPFDAKFNRALSDIVEDLTACPSDASAAEHLIRNAESLVALAKRLRRAGA
jgi:hypothetical protein